MDPVILSFVAKYTLLGIPALPLVVAIVALCKLVGMPSRFAPLAAVVAGLAVSGAIQLIEWRPSFEPVVVVIVLGLLLGLAAAGGNTLIQTVFQRKQFVPPGTAVKLPSGQVDVTPTDRFMDGKKGRRKPGTI